MTLTALTLRRRADGLTFRFTCQGERHGRSAYRRDDADHWICWHPAWGWMTPGADGDPSGLPFGQPRTLQGARPPRGPWVSQTGDRSQVFDLEWVEAGPC